MSSRCHRRILLSRHGKRRAPDTRQPVRYRFKNHDIDPYPDVTAPSPKQAPHMQSEATTMSQCSEQGSEKLPTKSAESNSSLSEYLFQSPNMTQDWSKGFATKEKAPDGLPKLQLEDMGSGRSKCGGFDALQSPKNNENQLGKIQHQLKDSQPKH